VIAAEYQHLRRNAASAQWCPDVEVGFDVRRAYLITDDSGVAGCLLRELHARGEAEFGVDLGEVGAILFSA